MSELQKFLDLLDAHWDWTMEQNPVFATRTGNHKYNDSLGKVSEEDFDLRIKKLKSFKETLNSIDTTQFDKENKLNYGIFETSISNSIERLEFRAYRLNLSNLGGPHTGLTFLPGFVPVKGLDDYNNYIARLHQIPEIMDGNIEIMKSGIAQGLVQPKIVLNGATEMITKLVFDKIEDSPFFEPFTKFSHTISDEDRTALKEEGIKAIKDSVQPALSKFADFVKNEYIPACREDIGASSLPNGEKFYEHCIRNFTSLSLTAKEIHEIGQSEVKRILSEMEDVKNQVGFEGSLNDFKEFLRTDEQFYPKSAEELMEKTAFVLKKIDGLLPEIFKTLPRLPYGIKRIPDNQAPTSTTAYYLRGSGDGTRSGTYFVNTYDLKSRPLFEIEALSLHEAVPGHHLQLVLQMELDLPNFRKYTGVTAFVEGWGLYSERLGLEVGFYEDPYSNFGRLSYEMWRACRLVVDTGMHALGWSRQQAIDFMMENTSLTLLNVTNEVDRYISWPGQALAYKLGELKIRELRKKAEDALGNRFDLRVFHDEVLVNGALPLNILEDHINEWINSF